MFDTIINIIEIGHLIGLLVLIVLYFTTPYILRKYVFTIDEESNDDQSNEIDGSNTTVDETLEKESEEDQI